MPPLPESAPSAAPAIPAVCPVCAEPLDAEDRFCGHCGHDVSAPAPAGRAPGTPVGAQRAGEPSAAAAASAGDGTPGDGTPGHAAGDGDPDAFRLAPPGATAAAPPGTSGAAADDPGQEAAANADGGADTGGSGDTLVLGAPSRLADPREEEPAAAATAESGPVCVACGVGGVDDDGYCEHCGHAQPRQRDHQEKELEGVAAVSDRGLRHHRNEDAFAIAAASLPDGSPAVSAVVCDGVSTAYRPDDASAAAAVAGSESLLGALERGANAKEAMHGALMAAFEAVTALADEEPPTDGRVHHNAPACTCVSAVVTGPVFTVGWIGDSRAYWIPDDRSRPPARLTEDDSWAARMVAAGLMSEAEAYADARAHAITGWLGADAVEVDPHVAAFQPDEPGVIVVCTDGLWNYAESATDMADAVPADARSRPLASARALLGLALDGGGHDNVTVAVLPFPAAVSRAGFPSA
ncbi:PP2C family serine/threonine-protein phosphatase [Actinacidiphila acidipaludis]|uniref:Protein phosphatase 2C domain-containing protein n=1 Tax=Actinacidiphila acidipaludis TaxID=2873382 RepID=A0ABS7QID8_9ACTN|nr:protein phosphatase 2C domain-containing protein [Streptomyces acidipaludis]MBY8882935.1 protein phosphatase 2C domain-containing protein [Streptomyces acidipaludis]